MGCSFHPLRCHLGPWSWKIQDAKDCTEMHMELESPVNLDHVIIVQYIYIHIYLFIYAHTHTFLCVYIIYVHTCFFIMVFLFNNHRVYYCSDESWGKFWLMETLEVTLSISLAMLLYTAFQLHPNAADAWNWQWGHRTLAISDVPQVFQPETNNWGKMNPWSDDFFLQMGEKKLS